MVPPGHFTGAFGPRIAFACWRMFGIPEFTSQSWQLRLVPDPKLLGTGPKYCHIQQVTENQGFYQIKKLYDRKTPEMKHIHLGL